MITRYGMSDDFDMVALETVTNQYLGGDASLACSAQTQAQIDKKVVELVRLQHQCERWRDRMLAEGDGVVNALVAEYPAAERQKLRQLVRDAQHESQTGQPPRSARRLYRYLRELLAGRQDDPGEAGDGL